MQMVRQGREALDQKTQEPLEGDAHRPALKDGCVPTLHRSVPPVGPQRTAVSQASALVNGQPGVHDTAPLDNRAPSSDNSPESRGAKAAILVRTTTGKPHADRFTSSYGPPGSHRLAGTQVLSQKEMQRWRIIGSAYCGGGWEGS